MRKHLNNYKVIPRSDKKGDEIMYICRCSFAFYVKETENKRFEGQIKCCPVCQMELI